MTDVDTSLEELNHWIHAHHMQGFWTQEIGVARPLEKPETISLQLHALPPGPSVRVVGGATNYAHFLVEAPPDAICVCDGEAFLLEAGDLVVNPAWTGYWVGNAAGSAPVSWLEADDAELLRHLGLQTKADQPRPGGPQPTV